MFLAITFSSNPISINADEESLPPVGECPQTSIIDKVNCYADKYGVNRNLAQYIVKNESGYNPKTLGDTKITCKVQNKYYGKPVNARGLFQITQCYFPEVTDLQAYDPDFNLDFGMKIVAQGQKVCRHQFTTCKNYYNK